QGAPAARVRPPGRRGRARPLLRRARRVRRRVRHGRALVPRAAGRARGGRPLSRAALVAAALAEALGSPVEDLALDPAGGGCINSAATTTAAGRRLFVKWNDRPLAGQFAYEAAGLRALAASGTSLVIPAPIAWRDDGPGRSFLVLDHLEPGSRVRGFDE